MRRLLSILASVGLVATASTSVVSCTKKDKMPTYNGIASIKSWTFESDSQSLIDGDPNNKKAAVGTIANMFKNPKALIDQYKEGNGDLNVTISPTPINRSKTQKVVYVNITQKDKTGAIIGSAPQLTFNLIDGGTYLDTTKNVVPYQIDISNQSALMYSTINNLVTDMRNNGTGDVDNYISRMSEGETMMSLDSSLFDGLADGQGDKVIAGIDKDGFRYKSIKQQFVMSFGGKDTGAQSVTGLANWEAALKKFNTDLLNGLKKFAFPDKTGKVAAISTANLAVLLNPLLDDLKPENQAYFDLDTGVN